MEQNETLEEQLNEYNSYTNAELEREIEKLRSEYDKAQKIASANAEVMLDLSIKHSKVLKILNKRNGIAEGE